MNRHPDVSRLAAFSDAVFGFALTLLVVTLETPQTFSELRNLIGSFVPFVLMFAMVVWIWHLHVQFFRRFPLDDAWAVFLNSALLFVVLFYVYPLKFLTLSLVGPLFMDHGFPAQQELRGPWIMAVYSGGVVVTFLCFLLLHLHAYRRRVQLQLSGYDLLILKYSMRGHLISMSLGVVSLLCLLLPEPYSMYVSGPVYMLMGPLHGWNGYAGGNAKSKFLEPPETPPAPST